MALDVDQSCLAQQAQVMGNGGLLDRHRHFNVTDTDLPALSGQDVQDLEPDGMAQNLVVSGKLLCGFCLQTRSASGVQHRVPRLRSCSPTVSIIVNPSMLVTIAQ